MLASMRALLALTVLGPLLALDFAACGGDGATSPPLTGGGAGGSTSSSSSSSGAGGASCGPTESACGAQCIDVSKDAKNCGACGYACLPGESCCEGACSTGCPLTVTAVAPATGPMSGGTWLTVKGKGFAQGARVHLGKGRAPARVVDPETLLVEAPPGVAGTVDVRVDQGANHASRGNAYAYGAYGLTGAWQKIDMSAPRGKWPGIAVTQTGRVLISGGVSDSMGSSVEDTADVYDQVAMKSAASAGKMSAPRWTQASVTLLTGKTLVLGTWFGGYSPPGGPIADLFEPQAGTFAPTASPPSVEHRWPHAVLLADGRALVVSYQTPGVELYDPDKDAFSLAAGAPDVTGYRPARLLDGRVLLVKGGLAPTYVFNSDTGAFTPVGIGPTATDGDLYTLPDGRVLYVAGSTVGATSLEPTGALELWEPGTKDFKPATYHLATPRQRTLTTAMAGDGAVLVLGGEIGSQVLNPACSANTFVLTDTVERIDTALGMVTSFQPLPEKNFVMSATTMLDGSIVAAGGAPCGGGSAYPYFYFLKGDPTPK